MQPRPTGRQRRLARRGEVGAAGGFDRVEVQVDDAVELTHGQAHGLGQLLEVELVVLVEVVAQVDRTQVAHRGFIVGRDFQDFRAQVGQVDHVARTQGLVAGAVALVLEGHPAVTGLGQGTHHAGVQLAGGDGAVGLALRFGLQVGGFEGFAEQVGELRHDARIEQRPFLVGLDALHEQVRHPVGQVQVVGTAGFRTGGGTQLKAMPPENFDSWAMSPYLE